MNPVKKNYIVYRFTTDAFFFYFSLTVVKKSFSRLEIFFIIVEILLLLYLYLYIMKPLSSLDTGLNGVL